jgi:nitrate reductase gamma subunit
MHLIPYIFAYAGIGIFLIAVVVRFRMWATMPIHVRWELYPVAHEPSHRVEHGGSYLEEGEWWKKPREVSTINELKAMIPEILFLVALKEHNPKLWIRSFPFHFGLYLVIGCTALMFGAGWLSALAPEAMGGVLGQLFHYGILASGAVGLALSLFGALGLLQRRLTDPDLEDFTKPADIFNLVFFVVAFGLALVTFVAVDPDFAVVSGFVANLAVFDLAPLPGEGPAMLLPLLTTVLLSLLVLYIPLTHMSHFVGKYFAYHAIRWNDTPNLPGGPEEAKIHAMLGQKVDWAAAHIEGGGTKTWADIATADLEVRKEQKK